MTFEEWYKNGAFKYDPEAHEWIARAAWEAATKEACANDEIKRLHQRVEELEALHVAHVEREAEHSRKRKALQLEIAALKTGQGEPVAWMYVNDDGECEQIEYGKDSPCEGFIPLYTSAPTIPEGWQLVPTHIASRMADWMEEAADDIEDWGGYASDYFQNKHDLKRNVDDFNNRAKMIRDALAAAPKP